MTIRKRRHAPDDFATECKIARLNHLRPIDFPVALCSQFGQQQFSQFIEQHVATALTHDESRFRSGWSLPNRVRRFPQSLAVRNRQSTKHTLLVKSVEHILIQKWLHVDRADDIRLVSPYFPGSRPGRIQFHHQTFVTVASSVEVIAGQHRRHNNRAVGSLVGK